MQTLNPTPESQDLRPEPWMCLVGLPSTKWMQANVAETTTCWVQTKLTENPAGEGDRTWSGEEFVETCRYEISQETTWDHDLEPAPVPASEPPGDVEPPSPRPVKTVEARTPTPERPPVQAPAPAPQRNRGLITNPLAGNRLSTFISVGPSVQAPAVDTGTLWKTAVFLLFVIEILLLCQLVY